MIIGNEVSQIILNLLNVEQVYLRTMCLKSEEVQLFLQKYEGHLKAGVSADRYYIVQDFNDLHK